MCRLRIILVNPYQNLADRSVQYKGNKGRSRLTSFEYCVQAKGDAIRPRRAFADYFEGHRIFKNATFDVC